MFGNFGEMASLLGKVKDIQKNIKQMKEDLPGLEFSASSLSGKVTATVSGDFRLRRLEFAPAAGNDAAAVSSDITEAVNLALDNAKAAVQEKMKEAAGGINLPGLF